MSERHDRQLEYLDLEDLEFDPQNPRLPLIHHGTDVADAIGWLLDRANLIELMQSIGQQDYFAGEPILVTKTTSGKFKVVEGNRRFGACLLLSFPDLAPTKKRSVAAAAADARFKPKKIPALVFEDDSQVIGMLGYRHITGIQEWGPLSKARYLRRMWDDSDGPDDYYDRLRFVARSIGSRSDYVARLLTALGLFEQISNHDFFGIEGLDESTLSFSLLVVAMNRPTVAEFIGLQDGQDFDLDGLDVAELRQLSKWLYEKVDHRGTVLRESRNFSLLVEVIQHPDALAMLRTPGTTLERAYSVAISEATKFAAVIDQMQTTVVEAIRGVDNGRFEPTRVDVASSLALVERTVELHEVIKRTAQ